MKRVILRISISLFIISGGIILFALFGHSKSSSDLSMQLSTEQTTVRVGDDVVAGISITNNSNKAVLLVNPGDGSESGWRTPIVKWSILEVSNDSEAVPKILPDGGYIRYCGNINSLRWSEVFRLAPGETRQLIDWIYVPPFQKAGIYKLAFLYENRPSLEWKGNVLGMHNPAAMMWIKHSTECSVTSNELVFTVTE